jgi:hypothetical protein
MDFITNKESIKSKDEIIHGLNPNEILSLKNHLFQTDRTSFIQADTAINTFYEKMPVNRLVNDLKILNLPKSHFFNYGWSHFVTKIPTWIFILFTVFITWMTFKNNLSMIPLLGLLSCLYMMSEISVENWFFFTIWLFLGLLIYFSYGRRNSKLAKVPSS